MAEIAAYTPPEISKQAAAVALPAPAINVMTPPTGDATPQTHAVASLTG